MPVFLRLAEPQTSIIIWGAAWPAQPAALQAALAQLALTFAIILIHPALVAVAVGVAPRLAVLVAQAATTVLVAAAAAQVARLEPWAGPAALAS
jgi:hypothetical protein